MNQEVLCSLEGILSNAILSADGSCSLVLYDIRQINLKSSDVLPRQVQISVNNGLTWSDIGELLVLRKPELEEVSPASFWESNCDLKKNWLTLRGSNLNALNSFYLGTEELSCIIKSKNEANCMFPTCN